MTATYSGDGNYSAATATGSSFIVNKADTAFTEGAAPATSPLWYRGHGLRVRIANWSHGDGDVRFGRDDAVRHHVACCELQHVEHTRARNVSRHGDILRRWLRTAYQLRPGRASPSSVAGTTFVEFRSARDHRPRRPGHAVREQDSREAPTGTLTFSSGGSTLCTATLANASCGDIDRARAWHVQRDRDVLRRYRTTAGSTATGASFTVTEAATAMTEAASPSSITFGTQDTLSVSGLPGDAAGIVNFISGVVILCTAVLPRIELSDGNDAPGGQPQRRGRLFR